MSHPLVWSTKLYFYPIGNTSPVCLTQDLAPEEPAKILLLGCGDPRNILYTLHASATFKNKPRTLDFTCCDFEPAILARNALLFTLIVDDHPITRIWNIFYHFKIDEQSFSLLVRQCQKLVDMSANLESWSTCPYSQFLRFCSRHTLSQIRGYWQRYASSREVLNSKSKKESLSAAFKRVYKDKMGTDKGPLFSAARSAGLFWILAAQVMGAHLAHWWQSGTVFSDAADIASATFINPTFVYSLMGEGCFVHYGTCPLQSFHLASAFADTPKPLMDMTEDVLVSCAKSQFQQWCSAFKASVSSESHHRVIVRLFAGDALALCHTLRHCRITSSTSASICVSDWAATELVLDGGDYGTELPTAAPTEFNVIDTSNIMDHVGLFNLFLAATPLLSHGPSSTLYTEALLSAGKDPATGLVHRLCADIPAFSLLFGVSPTGYVSNFTSQSNVHEIMCNHMHGSQAPQYHERISWKAPYLGDSVVLRECRTNMLYPSFEPLPLARLLFEIYYRMFQDEDVHHMYQNRGNDLLSQMRTLFQVKIHYHRATFAALLGLVKSRVQTDWTSVMEHLFDMLHNDHRLMLGSNNYQELCCQLFIRDIYRVDALTRREIVQNCDWSGGRFRGWDSVPPVVCLLLVVPRRSLRVLETTPAEEIGSPTLHCYIRSTKFHNAFSAIHAVFGSVSIEGSGNDARATLNEAAAAWGGTSNLVLSMWVPDFNLALDPHGTKVGFSVRSTPGTVGLANRLGPLLTLFSTDVMDSRSVHVLTERPGRPAELASHQASSPQEPVNVSQPVSVNMKGLNISTLAVRWEIIGGVLRDSRDEVRSEQVSPCAMKVTLGQLSKSLLYPFPVDGKRSTLRIARKSGWIEVVALIAEPFSSTGFTLRNFPLLLSQDDVANIWNVHRLTLEQLPILTDVSRKGKSEWINPHVSLAFSDRELSLRDKTDTVPKPTLYHLKDSLHSFFGRATEPNAGRIFGLTEPSKGLYTIIYLNHLRLDLASHTLVADVCIWPLTIKLMHALDQNIANFAPGEQMVQILTSTEEMHAWKHLLPVFAERCRTWSHKQTCEYVVKGDVPLGVELRQNPMCSCGEGVRLGSFAKGQRWKKLAPFATRGAISPLFAVSYMESVGAHLHIPSELQFEPTLPKNTMRGVIDPLESPIAREGGATPTCAHCGAADKQLLKCGRCKEVSYCGRECQTAAWKSHKIHCKGKR